MQVAEGDMAVEQRVRRRRRARPNDQTKTTSAAREAIEADLLASTPKLQCLVCTVQWKLSGRLRPSMWTVEAQVNILGAGCDWKLELESLIHHRFLLPLKNIFLGLAGSMSGVELYTSDS